MTKLATLFVLLAAALDAGAQVTVAVKHSASGNPGFRLPNIPPPSRSDAAAAGTFSLVSGTVDQNSPGLSALNDGRLATSDDQPSANFFFAPATAGGRLLLELPKPIDVKQINSYSWHPAERGPQVYTVFGGTDADSALEKRPKTDIDPTTVGWKKIATVRARSADEGGQFAVSISDPSGTLGHFRYLLFDISPTAQGSPFAQTFFSEIDVIDCDAPAVAEAPDADELKESTKTVEFGAYTFIFDTTQAPDLAEWTDANLVPVVKEWYPKLVAMLPTEGFQPPTNVTLRFRTDMGGTPASAGGRFINCNASWFRNNLKGEAVGSVVHEMVHTVQQYGWGRRNNPDASRTPGWITEGIPDYIRWFLYEPHSRGAEITSRNLSRAKYDASYRVTGNFIHWVTETYDKDIARKLNDAARRGKYSEDLWKEYTGKTIQELGAEWLKGHETRLAKAAELTKLSEEEKAAGWKHLFNAADLSGWSNYKSDKLLMGWQVVDGALTVVDPKNAGDIVTREQFDWFELQLDYNISKGGNSGIMYHVTTEGPTAWTSGPEVALQDNATGMPHSGWLYALYQPANDPATDKPIDATKPAGEWNTIRLLITPQKCEHWVNGVKYFEYNLDSEDFKARVAKSKFNEFPDFAKTHKGSIALQGDHGKVSFRNIKIRPIKE